MNFKLISFTLLFLANIDVNSQDSQIDFFYSEENNSEYNGETSENFDPIPVPTPINDYLPLLAVAAVGLGFYYRKELNQTIKSN